MLNFLEWILSSLPPDNMIRFYLTHCPTIFLTILNFIIQLGRNTCCGLRIRLLFLRIQGLCYSISFVF